MSISAPTSASRRPRLGTSQGRWRPAAASASASDNRRSVQTKNKKSNLEEFVFETSSQHPRALTAQDISARIERLPITRKLSSIRVIIGAATFFDAYTVLAIAFAMPVLSREWQLTPSQIGMILSFGYLGQLVGAVFFGWLAERIGRLQVLLLTIILFVGRMSPACLPGTPFR
jgi:hypothetical protein